MGPSSRLAGGSVHAQSGPGGGASFPSPRIQPSAGNVALQSSIYSYSPISFVIELRYKFFVNEILLSSSSLGAALHMSKPCYPPNGSSQLMKSLGRKMTTTGPRPVPTSDGSQSCGNFLDAGVYFSYP